MTARFRSPALHLMMNPVFFISILWKHMYLSQENTNFTNHFLNVLSSRFQSITHKLSVLTKLYNSYLLTICSQSCYTLKVKVLVAQWCLTFSDPVDCSPPGSSVHGILQARISELVTMPSSRRIFLTEGLNLDLRHCRQILNHLSHQGNP